MIPSPSRPTASSASRRNRGGLLGHLAEIGASAQAAIPGLYAWAITVAPAAWARGASPMAKVAAFVGVLALVSAPFVEWSGRRSSGELPVMDDSKLPSTRASGHRRFRLDASTGAQWARIWSVWGLVLSSAIVWVLVPAAVWSAKLDAVRGVLGIVGWALFAFASAGPSLHRESDRPGNEAGEGANPRVVASRPLASRSQLPRGDGIYLAIGVTIALTMQVLGWSIAVPERAVLVRLVTVACGVAVLGATTSITLARHVARVPASSRLKFRRALPWLVILILFTGSGLVLTFSR